MEAEEREGPTLGGKKKRRRTPKRNQKKGGGSKETPHRISRGNLRKPKRSIGRRN